MKNRRTGAQDPVNPTWNPQLLTFYPDPPLNNSLTAWLEWTDLVQRNTSMSRSMIATAVGVKPQYLTNILHGTTSVSDSKFDIMRTNWREFANIVPGLSAEWAKSKATMMIAIMELHYLHMNPPPEAKIKSFKEIQDVKDSSALCDEWVKVHDVTRLSIEGVLMYHGVQMQRIEPELWQICFGMEVMGMVGYMMKNSKAADHFRIGTTDESIDLTKYWGAYNSPEMNERIDRLKEEQVARLLQYKRTIWESWPDDFYDKITLAMHRRRPVVSDKAIYEGLGLDPFVSIEEKEEV
jgi:hypothetical protein